MIGVRRSKGFTLVEMMIVVAIVGVIALVAIPNFFAGTNQADMRAATRRLRGNIAKARTLAATGKNDNYTGWAATDRTVEAGVQIDATGYRVFVDNDRIGGNGTEAVLEIVNFQDYGAEDAAPQLQIVQPAPGTQIRFQKNGTLTTQNNQTIIFRDTVSGMTMSVLVAFGGSTRVE